MRTLARQPHWLVLVLILALGLTGCFQSAGNDLPPTQTGGNIEFVDQSSPPAPGGPSATPLVQPTQPVVATTPPEAGPTVDVATEFPSPIPVEGQGGGPTATLTATAVVVATLAPTATNTPPPTYTPPPTQTPLPTYTPPPTYTQLPTYTPPPSGPTVTFTWVPRVTFTPTATYTPFAGAVAPPQEALPIAERPTLAAGGTGGPVNQPVSYSPTPLEGEVRPVAQVPTLTTGQMTATQIVYEATANAAATLGYPTPLPPDQPTQPVQPQQPGQPTQPQTQPITGFPPNATVVTATPFGVPGICDEHLIQVNETLYRIAIRYGVTADQIAQQNNITNPDLIEAGETLLIPCPIPTTPTPIPVPVVQGAETGQGGQGTVETTQQIYVVQAGDNIYQISLRFDVDMADLVAANGLNAVTMNMIYVGQELIIPGTAVPVATPVPGATQVAPAPGAPTLTPYIIIVTAPPGG